MELTNKKTLSDRQAEAIKKFEIRKRREKECFSIINRGKLWYDELTIEQTEELQVWYYAWLDVTDTNIIPEAPVWLSENKSYKS